MKKFLVLLAVVLLSAGLLTACGSSGSDPAAGTTIETTGSSGYWTINMKGGNGATGGRGGYWYTDTYQVQGVKILKSGTAATSFAMPAYNPPVDLGTNACTVSTNTTILVHPAGAGTDPGAGVFYMVGGQGYLYKGVNTNAVTFPVVAEQCSGLKVNAGVTLTLGLNYDTDANGAYDMASVYFPTGDADIDGTLKTADLTTTIIGTPDTRHIAAPTARDMGALYLDAQQVFVHSTGSIITRGLNGTVGGQRGGDGGLVYIYARNYFVNNGTIDNSGGNGSDLSGASTTNGGWAGVSSSGGWGNYLEIYVDRNTGPDSSGTSGGGVFVNTGKITTNGGNGATGGDAPEVYIYANTGVFNKGPISANGGEGTNGYGGYNSGFYIYSDYAGIYNSGALSQRGGNGTLGGGNGGYFYLSAGGSGYSGDIVDSGSIDADAGSSTGSGVSGSRPYIYMYAYGAIQTSGKLSANGGDSKGANAGGTGGYLYMQNYVPSDYGFGEYMPVRPIQVSGNIYANGGASQAGTGGAAGNFYVYQAQSSSSAKSNTGVQFLGYKAANLSGGNGTTTGGNAYEMHIYTYNDYAQVGYYSPAGPIQNQLAITMKGGNGAGTGAGGHGGYLDWESEGYYSSGGVSTLTNSGKIDVSGGNGGSGGGGLSNEIYWYGQDGVKNTGALVLRGGNSVGGTGGDGAYSGLYIYASGDIVNSGAIDTTGGSGAIGGNGSWWAGGSSPFGNWVRIYAGGKVTNTGSMTCVGGAGTVTNGNGGAIDLMSERGATVNTGAMNVNPGSAPLPVAAGQKGQVWIDWAQIK